MKFSSYEGPRDGDYVAYVDALMRASPEFRRTQRSIAGAIKSAVITPGSQAGSPMNQLRSTLQKARAMAEEMAEQVQPQAATAPTTVARRPAQGQGKAQAQALTKEEARQRFRAMERDIESKKGQQTGKPWISPGSIVLIVGGVILAQFVGGFGVMLAIMGLMSAAGSVLKRLQDK